MTVGDVEYTTTVIAASYSVTLNGSAYGNYGYGDDASISVDENVYDWYLVVGAEKVKVASAAKEYRFIVTGPIPIRRVLSTPSILIPPLLQELLPLKKKEK